MKRWIKEPEKRLPVSGDYDVIVVGGGIAGISAAISASRCGARVALIEKECSLGGLATLGNVVIFLPLCDGMGNQVIKGIGEELLKASVSDGYEKIPECWLHKSDIEQRKKHRYRVCFNPASFILKLESLVIRNNINLYYDTRFCDTIEKNGSISAVIVENKSGRSAISCRTVVDASGDADVCNRAGERTVSLSTNVKSSWFFYSEGNDLKRESLSEPYDPLGKVVPNGTPGYTGDKADDVTKHVVDTREFIRKRLKKLKQQSKAENIFPILLPTIPSLRMTRRLKGKIELNVENDKHIFTDSVGMTGDWRKPGPVFYIPLRALYAPKIHNLITAGRCISADSAWDVTRAIPTCTVTGQAAGIAAALASRMKTPRFPAINMNTLQKVLKQQKVLFKKRISG